MLQRNEKYAAVLASALLLLVSWGAPEKTGRRQGQAEPLGTWTRQEGEAKIEFSGKDVMKIYPHATTR